LYVIAGVSIVLSRWPSFSDRQQPLVSMAVFWGALALVWHGWMLWSGLSVTTGLSLSLGNTVSFVGLQIACIAALGAAEPALRGLSGGLLLLAGVCAAFTGLGADAGTLRDMSWQIQTHVMLSLFAYGLLTVGAIVSVYALVQDRRLRTARFSTVNQLFAPLETTEKLLFGVTSTGFIILLLAIFSGLAFVENLFAQHLVHKTVLSLLALVLFGVLLAGRRFAGWRGKRAMYLYLWGFLALGLAYFGSRYVLESILGRSWG
jgi:ABC-type uncharacterized transport system permease subunit